MPVVILKITISEEGTKGKVETLSESESGGGKRRKRRPGPHLSKGTLRRPPKETLRKTSTSFLVSYQGERPPSPGDHREGGVPFKVLGGITAESCGNPEGGYITWG